MIKTQRLNIIPCTKEILEASISGDDLLGKHLNINIQDNWTEFGVGALQYSLDRLNENNSEKNWWTYFPIHREKNMLIGSGGYKGIPDSDGIVELGYEIAPAYRNLGFATELTKGLIENAFNHKEVKLIIAHTLGEENPSTKVLSKCGFRKTQELQDSEVGAIWRWELARV